jgi:trehalose 6-phosphate phosphatase
MNAEMKELLDRMCMAYRRGCPLVLLFDYDGTLTPIVERPEMAVLDDKTKRLLAELSERLNVHVGVLSGRGIDELQSLVPLPHLYFAGTSGMEVELHGNRIVHPRADFAADLMRRLAAQLEEPVKSHDGAWLERKRLSLTVHYRQTPDNLLRSLQAAVEEVVQPYAGELRITQGPMAWEITSAKGWNKGSAIRLILADFGTSNDILLYAGDGENDADAIAEVMAMGGVTFGIGPDASPAATYRLPNHTALIAFLSRLNASLKRQKQQSSQSSSHRYSPHIHGNTMRSTNPKGGVYDLGHDIHS